MIDDIAAGERRNFYGRIRGKTLRASQKTYLAEDLAELSLRGVHRDDNPGRLPVDLSRFGTRPLWLEVGFGGGEHLVAMAARYPGFGIVGCEPFVNGIAMLLGKVRAAGLENLALHPGDVRDLFEVLPGGIVQKAFLNYPDPWPKTRHHKRRMIQDRFLDDCVRVLEPRGELRVATDHADYWAWMRRHFDRWVTPDKPFEEVPFERPLGAREGEVVGTNFERKYRLEGREFHATTLRKRN